MKRALVIRALFYCIVINFYLHKDITLKASIDILFAFCILCCYITPTSKQKEIAMILKLTRTLSTILDKNWKKKPAQSFLFLLTGFLLTIFFLLNILVSQHPKGGWQTALGNISTTTMLSIVLVALVFCLIALWRSATSTPKTSSNRSYSTSSTPMTFIKVSPE